MSKEEIKAKIENAVTAIGVEEATRRPLQPPVYGKPEWKTMVVDLDLENSAESIESRISETLDAGWYFSKEIVARSYLILIFWRQQRQGEKSWPET